jgi:hypothetical protein
MLLYFTSNWHFLWPSDVIYGHLVYFPVLVCCTKKNLATLKPTVVGKAMEAYSKAPKDGQFNGHSNSFRICHSWRWGGGSRCDFQKCREFRVAGVFPKLPCINDDESKKN